MTKKKVLIGILFWFSYGCHGTFVFVLGSFTGVLWFFFFFNVQIKK